MERILDQIKSKSRVKDYGEVFTNEREVKSMCDLIPAEVWDNINSSFLEPCCGEGVFILEILKRKFARCKKRKDFTAALNSVYGMDIQADNVEVCIKNIIDLCEKNFKITQSERQIISDHIMQADSLKVMKLLEGNEKILSVKDKSYCPNCGQAIDWSDEK